MRDTIARIHSAKLIGIDAAPVTVEAQMTPGIGIHLVGLADNAVKESLLRTVTAMQAKGYNIPNRKIVINLAPADLRKHGSGYDLPIAMALIAASGQEELGSEEDFVVAGELGLDGSVRSVPGAVAIAALAAEKGLACILPSNDAPEAAAAFPGLQVYGVKDIADTLALLRGEACDHLLAEPKEEDVDTAFDLADVPCGDATRRALEIAAAGGHNIILTGKPGCLKERCILTLAGLLPDNDKDTVMQMRKAASACGRPYRAHPLRTPHWSAPLAALLGGGGDDIRPGEVTLAHGGVLAMYDIHSLPRATAEALRVQLEDGEVTIARLRSKVTLPARFILAATADDDAGALARLNGNVMDHIDVQAYCQAVPEGTAREDSATIRERVKAARRIQEKRYEGTDIRCNSELRREDLEKYASLDDECRDIAEKIFSRLGLSARAWSHMLRMARTIADLAGERDIKPAHLAEAASFRFLDRKME